MSSGGGGQARGRARARLPWTADARRTRPFSFPATALRPESTNWPPRSTPTTPAWRNCPDRGAQGLLHLLADLARRLTIRHRVEFIAVSSYGDRESTESGAVRLLMDVRHDIAGKHVLMVEDIIDTGHTLAYLMRLLEAAARHRSGLHPVGTAGPPSRSRCPSPTLGSRSTTSGWWLRPRLAERYRTLPRICAVRR